MILTHFPGCCVAEIVHDFGGTEITEGNKQTISVHTIKEWLESYLKHSDNILVATTNSDQKEANQALKEMGFKHSKWISKQQHSETKIRLWWKEL